MKIAYLITGHTKFYKECLYSHSKILDILFKKKFDVDCFISTYNKTGILGPNVRFHDLRNEEDSIKYRMNENVISLDELNDLNNFYKPKLFELEIETEYTKIIPDSYTMTTSLHNASFYHICRMFKKFIDGIRLIERYEEENNFKYDFFIRTRFDVIVDIENFYFDDYLRGLPSSNDFHDVFFYGKRNMLNNIKNLNDFLNKIYIKCLQDKNYIEDKNTTIRIPYRNAEDLFTDFLKKENIEFKIDNLNIRIPRI